MVHEAPYQEDHLANLDVFPSEYDLSCGSH